MPPQIITLEPIPLAVIRRPVRREELGAAVRDGCGRAFAFARRRALDPGHNVAVYLDGGLTLEAGVEVSGTFPPADGFVPSTTPGGRAVVTTHHGPYGGLGATHDEIHAWCAAHGIGLAGPCWEIYGHWLEAWNSAPHLIETTVYHQVAGEI